MSGEAWPFCTGRGEEEGTGGLKIQSDVTRWDMSCTVHGVFMARILEWFAFLSPVGHLLSELFTMTHPSLGALHGTAHRFTELHKPLHHIMWCDSWRVTSLLLRDFSETWCSLWSFVCVCAKLLSHAQVKQEDLDEVNFQIIIFSYNGSNTATIKF